MKVEDLRIGNFINFEGDFCTVEQICFDGWLQLDNGQLNTYISECTPIKLTEDWLIKFGFKKDAIFGFNIKYSFGYFELWYFKGANEYLCENVKMIKCKVKYVHELQNLFFVLTGKELILAPEL